MEPFYPLHAYLCDTCFLVQLGEYVSPEAIFTEYAYFSSYADTWVDHVKKYAYEMTRRLDLDKQSSVVELASNDGYLLQFFVEQGIPVLGIEPAANVATVAIEKGIPTIVEFFGRETAARVAHARGKADLLLGNNVLAHVPDLNDFVAGMKILLKPTGVITMEFPHLMRLMDKNQFDTIYHEHFSYFSFSVVEKVFAHHGFTLFDVDELATHGGSIRIYGKHTDDGTKPVSPKVNELKKAEEGWGIYRFEKYAQFTEQVKRTKRNILGFLIEAKNTGRSVVGYGAPGKGNTLLNYCGIRTDFLDYTVDRNPYKQGKYTPGTHIPILAPEEINKTKPDYLFILPWNLKDEIIRQNVFIREWGGKFVVPIPEIRVFD
jgi:SAM-dependent methyltransferase